MFSTRPAVRRRAGSRSCASASGATVLICRIRSSSSGRRSARWGSGLGPSSLALLTRRSRRSPAAAASAARGAGAGTAPGAGGVAGGRGECRAVGRVGDVTGDGGDQVRPGKGGDGGGQPGRVAAVDDQPPAAVVQGCGERGAEPRGGAGGECGGGVHGATV